MSILKVARMGHPALRAAARALDASEIRSAAIQKLIDDMFETMNEYSGVGLAAPQVHEGVRLFVAEVASELEPIAIVNPELTPVDETIEEGWEGCLSIPEIRGRVPRVRTVRVRALDRRARRIDLTVGGFPARVIQHETDHLDGILFLDRMRSLDSLTFLEEFARYWSREEVPEE